MPLSGLVTFPRRALSGIRLLCGRKASLWNLLSGTYSFYPFPHSMMIYPSSFKFPYQLALSQHLQADMQSSGQVNALHWKWTITDFISNSLKTPAHKCSLQHCWLCDCSLTLETVQVSIHGWTSRQRAESANRSQERIKYWHVTIWIKLKNTMLTEVRSSQKITNFKSPFIWNV
jgi:hypothetical protein